MGAPSAYTSDHARQAEGLCSLGATDIEVADFLQIHVATLYRWKAQHPDFCEALKAGKVAADERVERSLYHRATGYTYDAVKVLQDKGKPVLVPYREHVPPDTTAMIFWLKNRRPSAWRDKTEVHHRVDVSMMSDDELSRIASGGSAGIATQEERPPKSH